MPALPKTKRAQTRAAKPGRKAATSRTKDPRSARAAAFEARRMDILTGAAAVFAEDGYHQTSVNSLALKLGVSKPVLYYYAKNKDDLLFQCWQVARDSLGAAIEDAYRAKLSAIGKLRRFFAAYAEIMCGDFGRCLALIDNRGLPPAAAKKDVAGRRSIERALREIIIEGQVDGSIQKCDPALAARALFGAFNGIPRWFRADGNLGPSEVADAYLDLVITGLRRG
jgi:AcrR family transcriptional regulator